MYHITMRHFIWPLLVILYSLFAIPAYATNYYISPSGNDASNGLSQQYPWATFDHAWQYIRPGDTLFLLDGIYYQKLWPKYRNGQPGNPITIKALNDGQAIIDGDLDGDGSGDFETVLLGECWAGSCPTDPGESPVGNYFIIEGIVAKNSSHRVFSIIGHHNVLRRVSGYNASVDGNSAVISLHDDTLVEDCVIAGTGRKMIYISDGGQNSIIRRCFAAWEYWQGANFCPGPWPWSDPIQIYNGSNDIIENSIAYGKGISGIRVFSQGGALAENNQVLGSISLRMGMNRDGTQIDWPCPPPPQSSCTSCADFSGNDALRSGFGFGDAFATQSNNLFQDIFAWGNGGLGFSIKQDPGQQNNRLVHATFINNGLGSPIYWLIQGKSMIPGDMQNLASITDSYIEGTIHQDDGARLTHQYINGTLTNNYLWPWPMEDRIRQEFASELGEPNFSVTCTVGKLINQYTNHPITNINVDAYCGTVTPPSPTVNPPPVIGDLDGDTDVDFLDLLKLINSFNTTGPANFNLTGLVDIFDFNKLIQSL